MGGTRWPLVFVVILIANGAGAQQVALRPLGVELPVAQVPSESSLVAAARAEAIARSRMQTRSRMQNRVANPSLSAASSQVRNYAGSRFRRVSTPSYRDRFGGSYRPNRGAYLLPYATPWEVFQLPPTPRVGSVYLRPRHPSQYTGR